MPYFAFSTYPYHMTWPIHFPDKKAAYQHGQWIADHLQTDVTIYELVKEGIRPDQNNQPKETNT